MNKGVRGSADRSQIMRVSFIFLCMILSISLSHASAASGAINDYRDLQSDFLKFKDNFSEVPPDPVFFSAKVNAAILFPEIYKPPINEEIVLSGADAREQVNDIFSLNSVEERTVKHGDVQTSSDRDNSMDIEISGVEEENSSHTDLPEDFEEILEEEVDAAISLGMDNGQRNISGPAFIQSNNLNILVSDISVTAINTMDGGTATAISNIIIEPVQIINPSQVSEKLR